MKPLPQRQHVVAALFLFLVSLLVCDGIFHQFVVSSRTRLALSLQSPGEGQVTVAWSAHKGGYADTRTATVASADQEGLGLVIDDLREARWLRIGLPPGGESVLKGLSVSQPGYLPLKLDSDKDLGRFKVLADVGELKAMPDGLYVSPSGEAPAIEIKLPRTRPNNFTLVLLVVAAIVLGALLFLVFFKMVFNANFHRDHGMEHLASPGLLLGWLCASVLLLLCSLVAVPLCLPGGPLMAAAYVLGGGLVFFFLTFFLVTHRDCACGKAAHRPAWWWWALPCYATWGLYLLAFWPGILDVESLGHWNVMLAGGFGNSESAAHILLMWACNRIFSSPAVLIGVQVLLLGAVFAWGMQTLFRLGAPRFVLALTTAVFALSPANGFLVASPWAGMPAAIALLALTVALLRVVTTGGEWLGRGGWVLVALLCMVLGLYHDNGLIFVVGTLLILLNLYRGQWLPLLGVLLLTLAVIYGVRGPAFQWLGVERTAPPFKVNLSVPDRVAIGEQTPGNGFNVKALIARAGEYLRQYDDATSPFWRVRRIDGYFTSETFVNLRQGDDGGYHYIGDANTDSGAPPVEKSLLPFGRDLLAKAALASSDGGWNVAWNPAPSLYLLLIAVCVAALRLGHGRMLVVLLPGILHALPFFIVLSNGYSFPYYYPLVALAMMLSLPLLFLSVRAMAPEGDEAARGDLAPAADRDEDHEEREGEGEGGPAQVQDLYQQVRPVAGMSVTRHGQEQFETVDEQGEAAKEPGATDNKAVETQRQDLAGAAEEGADFAPEESSRERVAKEGESPSDEPDVEAMAQDETPGDDREIPGESSLTADQDESTAEEGGTLAEDGAEDPASQGSKNGKESGKAQGQGA